MKYQDIQSKTNDELHQQLTDLRSALGKLRFESANSSLQKTHQISQLKKDVARVMTALKHATH
jgi:large subunit ribosomal protein L29